MQVSSVERTYQTINLERPDRIPVDLHNFAMAAKSMNKDMGDIFKSGEMMAESHIKMWERFHHDVILHENGVTALAEAMGAEVEYYPNAVPRVKTPLITKLEDINRLKVPDIYSTGTLPELLKATKILKKELGDEVFIMGRGDQGPFSLAALLRGIENFMMDLMTPAHEEYVFQLLEICTEMVINFTLAQLEAGAHATSMGESLAGPDVVSPVFYRKYALPYEKKIVKAIKEKGGIISLHICGNCTDIIEDMVATGAQILEVDEKADFIKVEEKTRGKTCLLGPVSPTVLRNGTPDEIKELTKNAIDIAGRDGGLILGPGCAMADDTPFENVEALVNTAREYIIG